MIDTFESTYAKLKASGKTTIVSLSTTANVNLPDCYLGGLRETLDTIAANYIFSDLALLPEIIRFFDGKVDFFFLDCEQKNNAAALESEARNLIGKSEIVTYKPNDITVETLDTWLTELMPDMRGVDIAIIGAGNIGFKTALHLVERGANVALYSRNRQRVLTGIEGLQTFMRGEGSLRAAKSLKDAVKGCAILLGCSPGTPVIDAQAISAMTGDGLIIDVGNGTIAPDAIEKAIQQGIRTICLTPHAGYAGFITRWQQAKEQLGKMRSRQMENDVRVIGLGVFGAYGDILVDDVDDPQKTFGVCDGKGDILCDSEAEDFLKRLEIS